MYSGNSNILDERRSVMDTKKIGTFISMNRKKKGYTQGQLAEKLGVIIEPFLAEESGKQGNQSDTDEGHAATGHELFHPQLGVKTLLDGGRRRTKNLYGVVKRTVPAGQVRQ